MKAVATGLLLIGCLAGVLAHAQISRFSHVIVVVQENRTPDNMFQALCSPPYGTSTSCSIKPTSTQYDIQTKNWLDKTSSTGKTQPILGGLQTAYDLGHGHTAFTTQCDLNSRGLCQMDGAALVLCTGTCSGKDQFNYVGNSSGIMDPYLDMVTQYGWGNYFFQTNQGPSFPAHQFLFGGTSAPSASDDAAGEFAAENTLPVTNQIAGCIAPSNTSVALITTLGETSSIYPCFEHETLSDLLESVGVTWKYYTPSAGGITTAPNAINHICQPNQPTGGQCVGPDWVNNVVLNQTQVLTDISACNLPGVSWVIPTGPASDHPRSNKGEGPSWVASIVNAVGNNPKCASGESYWNDTAILVTWDDWGGFYDHERPTILAGAQGDYQYGFRVPFFVISAYTPAGYINNSRQDFGSILRFIELNFGLAAGSLNFADARTTTDLAGFFNLSQPPRVFTTIPARYPASYFLTDPRTPTDPDDD